MKELVKRAALLTVGLLAAWGVAEILIRTLASFQPEVQFLARAGVGPMRSKYRSLEELLGEASHTLIPHQRWNNYYTNALGFMDREFSIEKPPRTRRIMALGDSFIFGSVAYPQSVLPLIAEDLRRDCGSDIEIMNFGFPGVGLQIYRVMHWLAAPRYKPDVVVVHFYMGNDGPYLADGSGRSGISLERRILARSYAWNYLKNSIRLLGSVNRSHVQARASPPPTAVGDGAPRGGTRASDAPDPTDRDFKPTFTEEAFAKIVIDELGQLYSDKSAPAADAERWRRALAELDAIKYEALANTGRTPIIVLYPSELQVYPQVFEAAKQLATKRLERIPSDNFDPTTPNRMLLDYCRREGLSCFDVTPALVAAAKESPEPLYRPRDTHWNIQGNRVAAAAEAAFLRKELCGTR